MKKYKDYMDGITSPDTLHEKLKHLNSTPKKSQSWRKYGTIAAALVVVLGLGGWGLSRVSSNELGGEIPAVAPETAVSEPAIVPGKAPPVPMPNSPGMEMMGGYEVRYGEGENATVAYFCLPYIQYGEGEEQATVDMALPVGVFRRDLTAEEIAALFGGSNNLISHLDWNDYTIYAHAMLNRDGSLWMLCVTGIKGDTGLEHFSLEVMPGDFMPADCTFYPNSVLNNIWERDVMASSYDGEFASSRRVSFEDRGYSYRFSIVGADVEAITERVSRLVRWVIAGDGLRFAPASAEPIPPAGGEQTTLPYDPNAAVSQGPDVGPIPTPTPTPVPTIEPNQ